MLKTKLFYNKINKSINEYNNITMFQYNTTLWLQNSWVTTSLDHMDHQLCSMKNHIQTIGIKLLKLKISTICYKKLILTKFILLHKIIQCMAIKPETSKMEFGWWWCSDTVCSVLVLDSTLEAILLAMEQWNVQHSAFVTGTFFKVLTWLLQMQRKLCEPSWKSAKSEYSIIIDRKLQVDQFSIESESTRKYTNYPNTREYRDC